MKTYIKVIIGLVICGVAFAVVRWFKADQDVQIQLKEPVQVEAVKAKTGPILRRVRTVGDLVANQFVELRPEVEGKVVKLYFKEGQEVKVGDPLFKLDDTMYRAKVSEAEARVAQTRGEYQRAVKLIEKGFGTSQMRDRTLAEMKITEANLEEAKILLNRTTIHAPFEGVIGLSEVSVGALVSQSTKLTTLVDLDPINVDFRIPESYLNAVHVGDSVDVTIEDFDILPVEGTITAISPTIDETTRTVIIRAQIPNQELVYRPGEFAQVVAVAGEIKNAVLVPQIALEREGEEEFVWLVIDNMAVRTVVSTGVRDKNEVQITHGVKANDIVISAGQFKVHDGEKVMVVNKL